MVPTFFPLIIAVPEVIFHVFHCPEIMTLQIQFQLREEAEIARSWIWALGRIWKCGNVFLHLKVLN